MFVGVHSTVLGPGMGGTRLTSYGAPSDALDDVLRLSGAMTLKHAAAETPFEYILAVDGYLTSGFGYTEQPTPPAPGRAPLDAFLIDTRDGYCQHFAGAMALMLRFLGVPARVAAGFTSGTREDAERELAAAFLEFDGAEREPLGHFAERHGDRRAAGARRDRA